MFVELLQPRPLQIFFAFATPALPFAGNCSTATIPRHNRTPIEGPTPAQLQRPPDRSREVRTDQKKEMAHFFAVGPIEEFGFNLHAERGKSHFIGAVDTGDIADDAGLETGQRVVGINGCLVSVKVHIHPFFDATGRTARLLLNLILHRGVRCTPVTFREGWRAEYYRCLRQRDLGTSLILQGGI
ncbi:hypothetical protein niasHS_016135 [Heterodera schachtii]|uniref:PDZ domain-containing protein n=1 Tax=Heterodera schachtii TaxID=97005 RepID=A0ABD2IAY2_HETSC